MKKMIICWQVFKSQFLDSYPNIESNGATVRVEHQRMHLNTQRCHILLLELARHMALDECGLSGTTVADQHALESWNIAFCCHCLRLSNMPEKRCS